ncbi:unnamed protein product [Alopecurus aequalis]
MPDTGGADLPNDLLGAIYSRCSSSNERARFAAACKSWRAAASLQPKLPALPLLLPSTGSSYLDQKARAYSPEDGRVLRSRLPWFPYGKRVVGSHDGGWVAAADGGQIEILNLFSRACRVPVKARIPGKISVLKVDFSEDPTSEGCILAAMTTRGRIALYRLGCPGAGWITGECGSDESFVDTAFCNGELYALVSNHRELYGHRLYKLTTGMDENNSTVTVLLNQLTIQWPAMLVPKNIFGLRGKLAAAMKVPTPAGGSKARIFKVFELVPSSSGDTAWAEVVSLGDHALFLGPGSCKAVHVLAGRHGKVQGNRIYYSRPKYMIYGGGRYPSCLDSLDLGSCTVYPFENKQEFYRLEKIISQGYHYREKPDGMNKISCTWIFPP